MGGTTRNYLTSVTLDAVGSELKVQLKMLQALFFITVYSIFKFLAFPTHTELAR